MLHSVFTNVQVDDFFKILFCDLKFTPFAYFSENVRPQIRLKQLFHMNSHSTVSRIFKQKMWANYTKIQHFQSQTVILGQ